MVGRNGKSYPVSCALTRSGVVPQIPAAALVPSTLNGKLLLNQIFSQTVLLQIRQHGVRTSRCKLRGKST